MSIQNQQSNLVYVVSLGSGCPEWSRLSWIDIVRKKRRYFHPASGSGWPKTPPNYIGVRYAGKLQAIYHVESYKMVSDFRGKGLETFRNDIPQGCGNKDYFLYQLGPEIIPSNEVKMGKIFPNGRVWATIDLLLTCNTISEARDLTKQRLKEEEYL